MVEVRAVELMDKTDAGALSWILAARFEWGPSRVGGLDDGRGRGQKVRRRASGEAKRRRGEVLANAG